MTLPRDRVLSAGTTVRLREHDPVLVRPDGQGGAALDVHLRPAPTVRSAR